jgi:hypothetical protein
MNEDQRWQYLVALSAPTFMEDITPPFGFTTRMLGQLRNVESERELVERIGLRAIFASLAVLLIALGVLLDARYHSSDLEPGLRSIVQVENVPIS